MIITCDGGCIPNPGTMAVGFVIRTPKGVLVLERGVLLGLGTNQAAEILAAAAGLEALDKSKTVLVRSDSQYVVKTMTFGWAQRANREHWARLQKAIKRHRRVRWQWVRGHKGDPDNERADRLAGEALRAGAIASSGRALLFGHEAAARWGDGIQADLTIDLGRIDIGEAWQPDDPGYGWRR